MMRWRIKMTGLYLTILMIAVVFLNFTVRPQVMTLNGYMCMWIITFMYSAVNYLVNGSYWIPGITLVGTYIICLWELEGTVTFLTIMAVSYTHLDVYKRQHLKYLAYLIDIS